MRLLDFVFQALSFIVALLESWGYQALLADMKECLFEGLGLGCEVSRHNITVKDNGLLSQRIGPGLASQRLTWRLEK